ncbi:hypothetical protein BN7_5268 [Wickerhamomyces ciferrii]|uniref:Sfi1 spindle body domain-containing protein n=1 Tax=Wickerhamomyces ciferrii (strain ATCC 14091 / BCRC 22168 / CBS 111 / JCM 3599 / NBRC 0793 / NRRL Y-1031 F-60-10) TaxID=1206466 RepID=K0KX74_WICCF|nr:uncharacterized protein BN7_5268 [Wickerhamomyces ciferrii]CCH45683.1 hypothetical protein BN7_5268 [Wickerhamomyces ciferrii]
MSHKVKERENHRLKVVGVQDQNTDALIQDFNRLGLKHNGDGNGDGDGDGIVGGNDNDNPFLDTTASYLAFGGNVSETRMQFQDNQPITPLRKSKSQIIPSGTPITPNGIRRRSSSSHDPLESPPSPYLDIDYLMILLQSLPNQQIYNDFKGILNQYLIILDEHNMNPAKDRFIITIFNQLKSKSNEKLNKIIDIFINDPSNLAMKLSNKLYFKSKLTMKTTLNHWIIKKRQNLELNKSWKIWQIYLKKKFISQWIYKFNSFQDDLISNADMFYQTKKTIKFWDLWKTNYKTLQNYEKISNYQIQFKFFANWKEKLEIDYDNADWLYQQNLLKSNINKWILETKFKTIEIPINNTIQKSNFFKKWHTKHLEINSLNQDGEILERVFHEGFFFTKWKSKSQITLNKTQNFETILTNSIKFKFFQNWQNALYFKKIENQVIDKRNQLLLNFIINQWKLRLKHESMLERFLENSQKTKISRFLNQWKQQLTLKKKINQVGYKTKLQNSMNLWKLSINRKIYERSKDFNIQSNFFQDWKRRTLLNSLSNEINLQKQEKYWEIWKSKKIELNNTLIIGDEAYEAYSKIMFLNNWKLQFKQNKSLEVKADVYNQGIYYQKFQKKLEKLKSMEEKADNFYQNKSFKSILQTKFQKWKHLYELKIQNKLELKAKEFINFQNQLTINSVFQNWNHKYNSYLKQEEIFKQDFQKTLIQGPFLQKWINKFNDLKDMELKSNEINNLNLISTGFTKLQIGYLKIQNLNFQFQEYENDANLKIILNYLKKWSLISFKSKRNNENIKSFQRRWDRAHCRAILLLWKGKTWEIQEQRQLKLNFSQIYDQQEDEIFGNNSLMTNEDDDDNGNITSEDPSPLKFKNNINNSNIFSKSLITKTPQKASQSIFNKSISNSTPINNNENSIISNSIIPGSEKIKRQRMEALKNHYSQIKYAIPSPLKSEIKNPLSTSTVKKLNFNKQDENDDEYDDVDVNNEEKNQFYFNDESIDNFENQISSPVISHKKINQNFLKRYNSLNKSKTGSNRSSSNYSDKLFKNSPSF